MKKIKMLFTAISHKKRVERFKRNYKKYSTLITCMMKTESLMELDYAAGYLTGRFEAACEYGEISGKQRNELLQIIDYVHNGERERKESE